MKKHSIISAFILIALAIQGLSGQDHHLFRDRDTIHLHNTDTTFSRYEWVMDSLKNKNFRYKWMEVLTDLVILPAEKEKITGLVPTQRSEVNFVRYEGYVIRSVKFRKLDVFGPSISDTSSVRNSNAMRIANDIHIPTTDKVLQRNLLFKAGDTIDAHEFSDNERILRDLSFIEDARIVVRPVEDMPDYADVIVMIKDRWSVGGFIELESLKKGKIELWDENIMGTGHEFQNNIHWDPDFHRVIGYEAKFQNRNIFGSFIDGSAMFQNVFETQSYAISVNRKFLTPDTKWAGRASLLYTNTTRSINYLDIMEARIPVKYNKSDFWIGRSFAMNKYSSVDRNRLNLILASRIYTENYFERPNVSSNAFYEYHDKTVWLNTIGFSSQSYYKSNLVYDYGRTEDIPIGYLANLTLGHEFGEFSNRFYTSVGISKADYISNIGYIYASLTEGGFFDKKLAFQQAVFNISLNFFTNLFIIQRFKYRQFISLNYTDGFRRFDNEIININNENGIRGFSQQTVYGNKKVVLNLESVTFTPYYLLGFRFTGFCFLDLARIAPEDKSLSGENFFTGFGFGLRIQNERLAFPAFGLRFGFYPNLPVNELSNMIHFLGEKKLNHENFYINEPSLLKYE